VIELVIFDVDGTLAEMHALELLPGVREFFALVFEQGCSGKPQVAIATNQGGVGMRYWAKSRRKPKYEKYPTAEQIEERMEALLKSLGADGQVPVYVSYRYRTKEGYWTPVGEQQQDQPRWQKDWRKPLPGMLVQAMQDAGVPPEQTLFVGDRIDDQGAAEAAGVSFEWAQDFFSRSWTGCRDLRETLKELGRDRES
jgi:HAD superfamily hydrolase (TIGR01662 family)